jgi:hypothetical protein
MRSRSWRRKHSHAAWPSSPTPRSCCGQATSTRC